MMGDPGALRMEMPDNRNDQARAHSQASRIRRRKKLKNQRGSVVKKPGHPELPEIKPL